MSVADAHRSRDLPRALTSNNTAVAPQGRKACCLNVFCALAPGFARFFNTGSLAEIPDGTGGFQG